VIDETKAKKIWISKKIRTALPIKQIQPTIILAKFHRSFGNGKSAYRSRSAFRDLGRDIFLRSRFEDIRLITKNKQ
jgi:hypothetical protein